MNTRERIINAAAELLVASVSGDISTRAICERAGVAAPALYRYFGDKEGLLAAAVDHAFEQYLRNKRIATPHEDPIQDLRDGWDSHTAWALEHPAFYELIFSQRGRGSNSAAEAQAILRRDLERCARAGLLAVPTEVATQIVMAANVGVTLMLVLRPDLYDAPRLSTRMREAVHAAVLSEAPAAASAESDLAGPAATLASRLAAAPESALSTRETALLQDWLGALADAASV